MSTGYAFPCARGEPSLSPVAAHPPSWAFLGPESEFQMGTADPVALASLSLSLPSPCHSSLFHLEPLVLE